MPFSRMFIGQFERLVFDYVARQKVGGNHLNYYILISYPCCSPDRYSNADQVYASSRATVDYIHHE